MYGSWCADSSSKKALTKIQWTETSGTQYSECLESSLSSECGEYWVMQHCNISPREIANISSGFLYLFDNFVIFIPQVFLLETRHIIMSW